MPLTELIASTDDLLVKSDASILPQKLMKVAQKWIEVTYPASHPIKRM